MRVVLATSSVCDARLLEVGIGVEGGVIAAESRDLV